MKIPSLESIELPDPAKDGMTVKSLEEAARISCGISGYARRGAEETIRASLVEEDLSFQAYLYTPALGFFPSNPDVTGVIVTKGKASREKLEPPELLERAQKIQEESGELTFLFVKRGLLDEFFGKK